MGNSSFPRENKLNMDTFTWNSTLRTNDHVVKFGIRYMSALKTKDKY